MKKRLLSVFACLALCLLLLPLTAQRAEATVYDHIRYYGIQVQPNTEDGSLYMKVIFEWEAVEELPYGQELKIGIPNGSIRDVTALTDNIESLDFDNSYMYVYLTDRYDAGEVFTFSYSWVQEYMYALSDDGSVHYDYTPGWFDEISIDRMELQWLDPAGVASERSFSGSGDWQELDGMIVGTDLAYGAQLNVAAVYPDWPTSLAWENSSENLPQEEYYDWGNDDWEVHDTFSDFVTLVVLVIILFVIISIIAAAKGSYRGGFGTRYVFVHGLWYPAGPNGQPRPGSVGTKHKPSPPRSNGSGRSGGFGGGSRGGGFGGGGFGGGGHCACASSCACACACACAGGGRAGCSAKNLYGAVHLSEQLTKELHP